MSRPDSGVPVRIPDDAPVPRRPIFALMTSNLFGSIGVSASLTVGALVVEEVGGTSVAGLGQAMTTLGAAFAAVPLARFAARRGRRWALVTGYGLAVIGAALAIPALIWSNLWLLLTGLVLFGSAQAANLQSRYAATDGVPFGKRGRAMSIVFWATTIGIVLGPNLSASGERFGAGLDLPGLAGPYIYSIGAFVLAAFALFVLFPRHRPVIAGPVRRDVSALAALRWAAKDASARTGVVLVSGAHAVMIMTMAMTPVHMRHQGDSLELVGLVISIHTLGMYAFSPVFGWLSDRVGTTAIAWAGVVGLGLALVLGMISSGAHSMALISTSLFLLGVGWSAAVIAGSAIIARVGEPDVRIPLQGAADAVMNYAGAAAAALAGPTLALSGFLGVNLGGGIVLAVVIVVLVAGMMAAGPSTGRETTPKRKESR